MAVLSTVKLGAVTVCANFIGASAYDTTVQSNLSHGMQQPGNDLQQQPGSNLSKFATDLNKLISRRKKEWTQPYYQGPIVAVYKGPQEIQTQSQNHSNSNNRQGVIDVDVQNSKDGNGEFEERDSSEFEERDRSDDDKILAEVEREMSDSHKPNLKVDYRMNFVEKENDSSIRENLIVDLSGKYKYLLFKWSQTGIEEHEDIVAYMSFGAKTKLVYVNNLVNEQISKVSGLSFACVSVKNTKATEIRYWSPDYCSRQKRNINKGLSGPFQGKQWEHNKRVGSKYSFQINEKA